ncbi:MAG: ATP-dependent exonuclease [Lutibacter sp.]|nr:MAG: ATP-dependent exonuclease [Lutibacter sp.]
MKKIVLGILLFSLTISNAQSKEEVFKSGEWLKYRMHYGLINAGYATVSIKSVKKDKKEAFHVISKGWTTGITKLFFKVKDNYQTWFYKDNLKPYHFRRRVDEGGHIISRDIYFDQKAKTALVKDHKKNIEKTLTIDNVQDILSSFYYLRSQDISELTIGDELELDMFLDYETFGFKMEFLGEEVIKTKFGRIKSLKFRPSVQSGRIFKAKESLTIWITADKNKIPIRIKADLSVGSLKADLDQFKGLANPFNIIFR